MFRIGLPLFALALLYSGCSTSFGDTGRPGDADGDGISDVYEGRDVEFDLDTDGTPDYLDLDSDDDCIPDSLERGDGGMGQTPPRDADGDGVPDFRDLDSDKDGLPDANEDLNCNGVADAGETSNVAEDTDSDGASDLVEVAAGTNGQDPGDNPAANGDFVFVEPLNANPSPSEDDLDFSTDLKAVDLYVMVDRSGSMSDEINSIRSNIASVVNHLSCAPAGNGQPGSCIPDLWSGVGSFTYYGYQPFINHLDIQPNASTTATAVPNALPADAGCDYSGCTETQLDALYSAATGQGSGVCQGLDPYQGRGSCAGSPAGAGGIGYPCFRPDALPVILMVTDEPFTTQSCAGMQGAAGAAYAIGAKVIGIQGSAENPSAVSGDLADLAGLTGAIDSSGQPLVFSGTNAKAAGAIEDAVRTVTSNLPLDIGGIPVDDPGDDVDAVSAFIDHIETLDVNSPECTSGLASADSNGDGHPDVFKAVVAGTPLCWKVVPKMNTTVETQAPTLYRAKINVYGDDVTLLDSRNVFFVVPPSYITVE